MPRISGGRILFPRDTYDILLLCHPSLKEGKKGSPVKLTE